MAIRLGTLNKVIMNGRLTRDPEHKTTAGGTQILNFGIASNRRVLKDGEWQDDACFVGVVAFGKTAENVGDRLHKGSAVLVEGRLQSRKWVAKDGSKRTTIEINAFSVQCLDKVERDEEGEGTGAASDDEIPF